MSDNWHDEGDKICNESVDITKLAREILGLNKYDVQCDIWLLETAQKLAQAVIDNDDKQAEQQEKYIQVVESFDNGVGDGVDPAEIVTAIREQK